MHKFVETKHGDDREEVMIAVHAIVTIKKRSDNSAVISMINGDRVEIHDYAEFKRTMNQYSG